LTPVFFHPEAEIELDLTISFYEQHQRGLGLDFLDEVLQGISKIRDNPARWPKHKYGTRKLLLHRFPFYLYYFEQMDCLWIVAMAHCSRQPGYWLERLEELWEE